MNIKKYARIFFVISALLIVVFSVVKSPSHNNFTITKSGCVVHGVVYCFLTVLFRYAYGCGQLKKLIAGGLLIFCISFAMECIQFYLPYRTFNIYDILANGCGVAGGMVLGGVFKKYK